MGARKKIAADKRKEARKSLYFASAKDIPSSPRKMRLVADMVRGMEVGRALGVLKFSTKAASNNVEKLLRSAIAADSRLCLICSRRSRLSATRRTDEA